LDVSINQRVQCRDYALSAVVIEFQNPCRLFARHISSPSCVQLTATPKVVIGELQILWLMSVIAEITAEGHSKSPAT